MCRREKGVKGSELTLKGEQTKSLFIIFIESPYNLSNPSKQSIKSQQKAALNGPF